MDVTQQLWGLPAVAEILAFALETQMGLTGSVEISPSTSPTWVKDYEELWRCPSKEIAEALLLLTNDPNFNVPQIMEWVILVAAKQYGLEFPEHAQTKWNIAMNSLQSWEPKTSFSVDYVHAGFNMALLIQETWETGTDASGTSSKGTEEGSGGSEEIEAPEDDLPTFFLTLAQAWKEDRTQTITVRVLADQIDTHEWSYFPVGE